MPVALRLLAAALLLAALPACTSSDDSGSPAQPVPSQASPSPEDPEPEPSGAVTRVVLTDADMPAFFRIALRDGGDRVKGQVTLEGCGKQFASEEQRIARRQVDILLNGTPTGASNEVVEYDSEDSAKRAIQELRASLDGCPLREFLPSAIPGQPDIRYQRNTFGPYDGGTADDSLIQTVVYQLRGDETAYHGRYVFLRRGAILDGFYLNTVGPMSEAELSTFRQFAEIAAAKLAAETAVV